MRTVDLGRTAAQAEVLLIQRMIRRQVMRVVWGAVAAVFGIAVLVMLHVLAFMALAALLPPILDAAAVLAFDAVLLIVFVVFALRGAPDPIEVEARTIRDQALSEMRESLAIGMLIGPAGRLAMRAAGRKNLWGLTLAALTARFLAKR